MTTMQEKFDRHPRRIRMGVTLLALVVGMAGCLHAATETQDASALAAVDALLPEWRHTTGTLFLRADLPGDGSHCKFHAVARGTSETLEPVIALAATHADWGGDGGPHGSRFAFALNNAPFSGIPAHATVAAADQVLADEGAEPAFSPEWIAKAELDFKSIDSGVAWASISNLSVHDVVPDGEENRKLHESLNQTTINASLVCGDHDLPFTVVGDAQAIMFTGPPSSGAAHAWIRAGNGDPGVSAAYIGVDNSIEWTATNESWYFGEVGGDPTKAIVVTLDHPGGLMPWLALPTTYGGTGIGDIFMEHQGGPGDYRLSGTGAGTGLFSWSGLVIID